LWSADATKEGSVQSLAVRVFFMVIDAYRLTRFEEVVKQTLLELRFLSGVALDFPEVPPHWLDQSRRSVKRLIAECHNTLDAFDHFLERNTGQF